jgi:glycerate dehydrogenase
MNADRFVIAYLGDAPPDRAFQAAAEYSVACAPINRENIAEVLRELRPQGFLVTGPEWNPPFLSADLIGTAGSLRLVTYTGTSTEHSDYSAFFELEALRAGGVVMTTAKNSVNEATAGLFYALALGLVPAEAARKIYTSYETNHEELHGCTLGIFGVGQIGSRVARLPPALGMGIVYDTGGTQADVEDELSATFQLLGDLLPSCDHISVHTSSSSSVGLVGREVLPRARGISIVNTAHPPIVEPGARVGALKNGWVRQIAIGGSYADPCDRESREMPDDRALLFPFRSWDTSPMRQRRWNTYIESLSAMRTNRADPSSLL